MHRQRRSETVFRTEWFSIERETLDLAGLKGRPFYRINSPDGVIVLALDTEGKVILVRQHRPAIGKVTLEFPSGGVDPTEAPEAAIARELLEETGYVCEELTLVGTGRVMLNRHSSTEYAFFGTGAHRVPGFEAKEEIETVLVSPSQFRDLVLAGEFEQFAALGLVVLSAWKKGGAAQGLWSQ